MTAKIALELKWDFNCEERVSSQLMLGVLDLKKAELLEVGDTRAIIPGNRFIHATYHLERPTVTVVIRTNHEKHHLPQYSYLEPFIAYNSVHGHGDAGVKRRLQLLRMLSSTGRDKELLDAIKCLLDDANHHYAFIHLKEAYKLIGDETRRNLLSSWATSKHGRLAESFRVVLDTQARRDKIHQIAEMVGQGELHFFTALLRNVPKSGEILKVVRDRFPQEDLLTMIARWTAELSRYDLSDFGVSAAQLTQPIRKLLGGYGPSTSPQAGVNRDEANAPVSTSPAVEHAAVVS